VCPSLSYLLPTAASACLPASPLLSLTHTYLSTLLYLHLPPPATACLSHSPPLTPLHLAPLLHPLHLHLTTSLFSPPAHTRTACARRAPPGTMAGGDAPRTTRCCTRGTPAGVAPWRTRTAWPRGADATAYLPALHAGPRLRARHACRSRGGTTTATCLPVLLLFFAQVAGSRLSGWPHDLCLPWIAAPDRPSLRRSAHATCASPVRRRRHRTFRLYRRHRRFLNATRYAHAFALKRQQRAHTCAGRALQTQAFAPADCTRTPGSDAGMDARFHARHTFCRTYTWVTPSTTYLRADARCILLLTWTCLARTRYRRNAAWRRRYCAGRVHGFEHKIKHASTMAFCTAPRAYAAAFMARAFRYTRARLLTRATYCCFALALRGRCCRSTSPPLQRAALFAISSGSVPRRFQPPPTPSSNHRCTALSTTTQAVWTCYAWTRQLCAPAYYAPAYVTVA